MRRCLWFVCPYVFFLFAEALCAQFWVLRRQQNFIESYRCQAHERNKTKIKLVLCALLYWFASFEWQNNNVGTEIFSVLCAVMLSIKLFLELYPVPMAVRNTKRLHLPTNRERYAVIALDRTRALFAETLFAAYSPGLRFVYLFVLCLSKF